MKPRRDARRPAPDKPTDIRLFDFLERERALHLFLLLSELDRSAFEAWIKASATDAQRMRRMEVLAIALRAEEMIP